MRPSKFFFLFLLFLFFILTVNSVNALDVGALGIRPTHPDPEQPFGKSWFIYTAEIGEEIKDKVDVVNLAAVPVQVRVWAADATTTPDGAYTIKEESTGIGTWITFFEKVVENGEPSFTETTEDKPLSAETTEDREKIIDLGAEVILDLEANETKTLDFKLVVPEAAWVGDHMGAIMVQAIDAMEELEKGEAEIAPGVKVVTRVGARVYLTVPGETIRILEFSEFSWEMKDNKLYFLLTLENLGNVRIEPKGEIIIRNIFGTKIGELKIPTREVFPKDEILLPVEWEGWQKSFWVKYGGFAAEAKIIYGPGLELTKELKAVALPWYVPAIFSGIIILLTLILVIRRMLKKQEKKLIKEYIVKSGETIESVAEKFGMSWKKIAKMNKLKPPYILKEGQKILILEKK